MTLEEPPQIHPKDDAQLAVEAETLATSQDEPDASGMPQDEPITLGGAVQKGIRETIDTFKAFAKAPREIFGLNLINVLEGMAYFGTLTYLFLYMTNNVGLTDAWGSYVVTGFAMAVTLSQLLLGGISDKIGARRALGIALVVLLVTRIVIGFAESGFSQMGTGLDSIFFFVVAGALLLGGLSYGLYQPALYSATRQYSDKRTSAVSYAMLYAGMNLGAFLVGLILPHIRRFSEVKTQTNGYSGSLVFIAAIMGIALILYAIFLWRPRKGTNADTNKASEPTKEPVKTKGTLLDWLKGHPLADLKFGFFIFILIPVQTLFVYSYILVPAYLTRAYTEFPAISDNFETFSNINPLIIFVLAPIIAALTARGNVYKIMIIGTTVMALPTFLLCFGQFPITFLTYIVIMSIGEAIWQPRFLQHVAEIAPKDKVGAYIGIAQLPWFLTKFIAGLYAGHFMAHFVPDLAENPSAVQNPEMMWLIFGAIAMISPIALFLARGWMSNFNLKEKV